MKIPLVALLSAVVIGPIGYCQNKNNLPFYMDWVRPHISKGDSWKTIAHIEFQGYWVPDKADDANKDGKGITTKSLFRCQKKIMSCQVVSVTSGMMVISLNEVPVKEWNEHRIVIEDDEVRPSVLCPVIESTVVDIDKGLIRGSESPLTARWNLELCKPLTPELSTSSETLAGNGREDTAGVFMAW